MHLALHDAPTPWTLLGTGERYAGRLRLSEGAKGHIPQLEGGKNGPLAESVETRARHCLNGFAQQDEPCITVLHHHSGAAGQGFSMHHGIDGTALVDCR